MFLSLDVVKAKEGDCLLLHFGEADANGAPTGLILIDGGPRGVYDPHLKGRLAQVREGKQVADDEPLPVDLLMVSHVDDDHVLGLLDLTREMIQAKDAHRMLPIQVSSFWHNSFDDIIGNRSEDLTSLFTSQFGTAALSGDKLRAAAQTIKKEIDESNGPDDEAVTDSLMVLASIANGFRLQKDAEKLGFPEHPEIDADLIMAQSEGVSIGQELMFTVAGPMQPELEKLQKKHDEWLDELKKKGKSPPAALAAYVDDSIPNLSSIVVLAELNEKKILLTGDARGDKIIAGLKLVGLLGRGDDSVLQVDILKVPHHGSARNVETDFFRRIIADHYVFSGDGKHGNPDRETLEMLFDARGRKSFTMHFTYPIKEIDAERKKDWEEKQKTARKRGKTPTEDWSARKHSLASFLKSKKVPAKRVRIVKEGKPHVIDLFDEVGF
jgi:hypothetical protein